MGEFKYEIHAHTKEVSSCGHVPAAEAVRMYRESGYQGIVFTDHFNEEYFRRLGNISWGGMIDRYLEGYRAAVREGKKQDMDILWGLELRFTENDNDYLVYGLDEPSLKAMEYIHRSTIADFMALIERREDVLVFQAHPFREGCTLAEPLVVHGLEVHNGNPRHDSSNHLAAQVARDEGLLIISGSDFHRPGDLATGGIKLPRRVRTMEEFISQVRNLGWDSLIVEERVCP